MIFENGLPRPNGASDFEDSPVIAGMAKTFEYPVDVDMTLYIGPDGKYRRNLAPKYDLSRDQVVELWSGLRKQGRGDLVDSGRITGKDLLAPSVKGHEQRCKGLKASWFQDLWLKGDMAFSAKFKPLDELNQLLTILWNHEDDWFIQTYCRWNPQWEEALRIYWYKGNAPGDGDWRDEKDFCEHVIQKITGRLAKKEQK
jgi:hypothetical protein